METGISSSFIPQDATTLRNSPSVGGSAKNSFARLILLISLVLFVASGALAAGVFFYLQYEQSDSASKLLQLKREREAIDPAFIQKMSRLDDRMQAADTLLNSHTAMSAFFGALQRSTLTTISFQNLNLESGDQHHINVKMSGVAQSVNSIALQAGIFSRSGLITNPIFSGINRAQDGVHFNLSAVIDPSGVNYAQLAGAAQVVPAQPQQQAVPATAFDAPSTSTSKSQTPQAAGTAH